jgi:hypothetical protein
VSVGPVSNQTEPFRVIAAIRCRPNTPVRIRLDLGRALLFFDLISFDPPSDIPVDPVKVFQAFGPQKLLLSLQAFESGEKRLVSRSGRDVGIQVPNSTVEPLDLRLPIAYLPSKVSLGRRGFVGCVHHSYRLAAST